MKMPPAAGGDNRPRTPIIITCQASFASGLRPRAPRSGFPKGLSPFGRRRHILTLAILLVVVLAWLTGPASAATSPLVQAKELLDAGKPAEAAALLDQTLKREPGDERLWALMGRARSDLGETAKAIEAYRMSVRINPADTLTRMRLDMLADLPVASPAHGGKSDDSPGRHPRPASALERAGREELAKAAADPASLGCGPMPWPVVLDPLPAPAQAADATRLPDDALELSRRILSDLRADQGPDKDGPVAATATRYGDYPVRPDEAAAVVELAGARLSLSLSVTANPGKAPSLEVLSLDQAGQSAPGGRSGSHTQAGQAAPGQPAGFGLPSGLLAQPVKAEAIPVSADEAMAETLWRGRIEAESARLARRLAGSCRAQGLASAVAAGPERRLEAVASPAVLVTVNLPPGPDKARASAMEGVAAVLARALREMGGKPCP